MIISSNLRRYRILMDDIILSLLLLSLFIVLISSMMMISSTYANTQQRQQPTTTYQRRRMMEQPPSRFLQEQGQQLAGYTSINPYLSTQSRIDLDIRKMEEYIKSGYVEDSYKVYKYGAYSNIIARVNILIKSTTQRKFNDGGATVIGTATDGRVIVGVIDSISRTQVSIKYITATSCAIGGLRENDVEVEGCFAPNGTLYILLDSKNSSIGTGSSTTSNDRNLTVRYTYNPRTNHSYRETIGMMSSHANTSMRYPGSGRFFPIFQFYNDYYGMADYANQIMEGLYFGTNVNFPNHNIMINFNSYDDNKLKALGVTAGSAILNVAMYSLRNINMAISSCSDIDSTCYAGRSDDICIQEDLMELDASVAYYVGSQSNNTILSSLQDGYLLYKIANEHCIAFKTCGVNGDQDTGLAKANQMIMGSYTTLKARIKEERCLYIGKHYERIRQYHFVPLIQGLLGNAFIRNITPGSFPDAYILGTMFTLSILPLVHNCSSTDADTLYNNMIAITDNTLSYVDVKLALENNYKCISGMTCSDVGGIWDSNGRTYFHNAAACDDNPIVLSVAPSIYADMAPQSVIPSISLIPTPTPTVTTPATIGDTLPPPKIDTDNSNNNYYNSVNDAKKPGLAVGMTVMTFVVIVGFSIYTRRHCRRCRRRRSDSHSTDDAFFIHYRTSRPDFVEVNLQEESFRIEEEHKSHRLIL